MKVIDDDDASLLPKIGADGFPLRGTVTRARDYSFSRAFDLRNPQESCLQESACRQQHL